MMRMLDSYVSQLQVLELKDGICGQEEEHVMIKMPNILSLYNTMFITIKVNYSNNIIIHQL